MVDVTENTRKFLESLQRFDLATLLSQCRVSVDRVAGMEDIGFGEIYKVTRDAVIVRAPSPIDEALTSLQPEDRKRIAQAATSLVDVSPEPDDIRVDKSGRAADGAAALLAELIIHRAMMITVSTGGPRIQEVDDFYRARQARIVQSLPVGVEFNNPHADLWDFYHYWDANLPQWKPPATINKRRVGPHVGEDGMADRYRSFHDLAANERLGIDYRIRIKDRGTPWVILAPHGGCIEPLTSEVAEAIAGTDFSFYAFEALKNRPHGELHITSHRFDEPSAIELVGRSRTAVAIHGRQNHGKQAVWLGGRAIALRDAIGASLCEAGFPAELNEALPGLDRGNICNRALSGEGVQLELPRSLRRRLASKADLLRDFCEAIRNVVRSSPDN